MSDLSDWQNTDGKDWNFFTKEELKCRYSNKCLMEDSFMSKLTSLRIKYGKPMYISSGYRDAKLHPIERAKIRPGAHSMGRAVDVVCFGDKALMLVKFALQEGFTGIGIKQNGNIEGRFIHLDDINSWELAGFTRPWIWSY